MNSTALRDVSLSLEDLLVQHVNEPGDPNPVQISFESPADIPPGMNSRISVYLFSVSVNPYLRNIEPIASPQVPGNPERHFSGPPTVVDLLYMITPFSGERATELILIEKITQTFHDYAVLTNDLLKGNLKINGNEELKIIPYSATIDDVNKIWSIFPGKSYKLGLFYQVTPVMIASGKTYGLPLVKKRVLTTNGGANIDLDPENSLNA